MDPLVIEEADELRAVRLELTRAAWKAEVAMAEYLRIANKARALLGLAPLPALDWQAVRPAEWRWLAEDPDIDGHAPIGSVPPSLPQAHAEQGAEVTAAWRSQREGQ